MVDVAKVGTLMAEGCLTAAAASDAVSCSGAADVSVSGGTLEYVRWEIYLSSPQGLDTF